MCYNIYHIYTTYNKDWGNRMKKIIICIIGSSTVLLKQADWPMSLVLCRNIFQRYEYDVRVGGSDVHVHGP